MRNINGRDDITEQYRSITNRELGGRLPWVGHLKTQEDAKVIKLVPTQAPTERRPLGRPEGIPRLRWRDK